MLNTVALMGRLTSDPELKHSQTGTAVVSFSIACDRNFCRAGEERQTDFINIVAWRQTAEFVCKYFQKGSMIALDGSIQTRNYQDKNGNRRNAFEIIANNVSFCGSKKDSNPGGQNQHQEPAQTLEQYPGANNDFAVIDDSEDLPF